MDAIARIEAREAVTRLIHAYCTTLDDGRLDDTADLFTDGVWRPGPTLALTGRDEVAEFLHANIILYADGTTGTRHVVSNICIDLDEHGRSAIARSYVIVYQSIDRAQPHIIFQGRYEDSFSCRGGVWLFTERRVLPDGFGDLTRHMRSA